MVHHLVVMPSTNQKIFAITGMGGCGKTQLVSYFLQEKGSMYVHFQQKSMDTPNDIRYTQVIFVDASSLSTIKADLQTWVRSFDGQEHR